jgi:hypothetical protein
MKTMRLVRACQRFAAGVVSVIACSGFAQTPTNIPPLVSMVTPTNGSVFYTPTNLFLIARASDPDGTVTIVEFFAGTTDLGQGHPVVLDPPGVNGVVGLVYFLAWPNVPPGNYALRAVAADNQGASTISAPASISVLPGPPPPPPTNLPPVGWITSPANGAAFRAPVAIPIFAYARDPDGYVVSVEFLDGTTSLGLGHPVTAVPPPLPPGPIQPPILIVVPTNYWKLVWTNALPGSHALTAKATDNGGLSTISDPVNVTILPPLPPPTNRPPLISIVATDPLAIEGTNCWPWVGLANAAPTWANWTATAAARRFFTNCGPKDAIFTVRRHGDTNNALTVTYDIGGTATNGVDYVALPGVVTIPPGQRAALITVVPLDDGPPDITSTVILKLEPSTNTPPDFVLGYPSKAAALILDFGPRPPAAVLPDKCFHLSAAGPNGAWFHVECTTDLLDWTLICTNQVINGSIDFVDPEAQSGQARFYRAVPEAGPPQE